MGEAINTACHTVNRVYLRPSTKKTPYELWKVRNPNVKFFRIFGSTCFILKDRENVGKFDSRIMKEYFWDTPLQARLIMYTTKKTRR